MIGIALCDQMDAKCGKAPASWMSISEALVFWGVAQVFLHISWS